MKPQNIKLKWKHWIPIVPAIAIIGLLGSALFFWTQPALERMMLDQKRSHMRDVVHLGWTLANDLHLQVQREQIDLDEAQRRFLAHIGAFRYGADSKDYLWVHDLDGNLLVHPYSEPLNLSQHRDKNGLAVVPEMNRIVQSQSEGFLEYYWLWKDIDQREEAKVSFVKLFEPWGVVIGSGFYRTEAIGQIRGISHKFLGYATLLVSGVLILTLAIVPFSISAGLQLRSKDRLVAKSQNRFEQMAKQISSGVAILERGQLVFYNSRLSEFLKLAPLEENTLPSQTAQEALFELIQCSERGDTVLQDAKDNPIRGCWIPNGANSRRYVLLRTTVDADSETTYVSVADWTQRKQHMEELDLLSKIVRDCPLSVVVTDTEGAIQYANPFASTSSGYSNEEMIGSNPRILKSTHVPAATYEAMWETITNGQTWYGELLNRTKSGTEYWESIVAAPLIDEHGKIQRFYAIKQEISQRKKLEQELVEARRKAEESERIKSAFLSNVSHEIRTPLNAICGFIYLLDEELSDHPQLAEFRETIHENTATLVGLVDDILKISELESSKYFNNYENWNLDELLTDSLEHAKQASGASSNPSITFHTDFDPNLREKVVYTDREKFEMIFAELISNAIKFTREGTITIGYRCLNGELSFRVSDTGVGIPEEEKPHIFKLFYHGEKNFVSLHKGTGLGLNIVKKLTYQMGGRIQVESTVGVGTTVLLQGICTLHRTENSPASQSDFCPVV